MFLHLGENKVVYKKDIVAIFDVRSTLNSKINREFLRTCEEEGFIDRIIGDNLRSFVIVRTAGNKTMHGTRVHCSSISSLTLQKRANLIKW